jgi:hypothetical protein
MIERQESVFEFSVNRHAVALPSRELNLHQLQHLGALSSMALLFPHKNP